MTEGPPAVTDLTLEDALSARRLVDAWDDAGGFTAKKVADAARVLRGMWETDATVLLSFPAAPVSTGLRGLLKGLVEAGKVDAIVTTCGTLDHDIARTLATYRQGSFELDDEEVVERGYHRLGSVLVPEESYGPLIEGFLFPLFKEREWEKARVSGVELCRAIGERLAAEPKGASSLLAACAARDVPVFVPGMTDGSVGAQLWSWYEMHRDFQLDVLADEHALNELVHDADTLGALMLGGGISKHHTIWWAQFTGGLDHAVYLTTAVEHDGSLSGARMREAISWGKLKPRAGHVTVEGDATVTLPLVLAGALVDV